jgi:hypothetical protein
MSLSATNADLLLADCKSLQSESYFGVVADASLVVSLSPCEIDINGSELRDSGGAGHLSNGIDARASERSKVLRRSAKSLLRGESSDFGVDVDVADCVA